jgi:ribose 5-phosphate isomerase A
MIVGLGTGSTAGPFIAELGRRLHAGALHNVRGIPTSEASRKLAQEAEVPLTSFAEVEWCDLTVDGADEIDPRLNLIKGLGGALLREKIVAQNSRRFIVVADGSKLVETLGSKCPLPVEVVPFGMERQPDFFATLGGEARLRVDANARPYVTDSGNHIYDVRFGPIADAARLEVALLQRAGVVQTGLFLGLAYEAIVATDEGVRTIKLP